MKEEIFNKAIKIKEDIKSLNELLPDIEINGVLHSKIKYSITKMADIQCKTIVKQYIQDKIEALQKEFDEL